MSATEVLARFAVETRNEQVPPWAVHDAKRCLINYLGVALGALQERGAGMLLDWVEREGAAPKATIIGTGGRTSAFNAALANGYLAHLLDYDDTHLPTILHPSAPVWPAVQAVAEEHGIGGRDALVAFVIGLEVASRLSLSVHPWHYDLGWHITGTAGVFGAAAAAGRLIGLTAPQMVHAFGLAGTQAAGVREVMGSMTKAVHPGKAAGNGVQSAALASMGFTSTEAILEGRRGFWAVLSQPGHDQEALVRDLGSSWEIRNNGLKPYANGVVAHPLQDAAVAMRNEEGVTPGQVVSLHARVHPLVMELMDRPSPRHGFDGKFSFQYCIAAGLVDGAGHPRQFTDERFHDPAIASLLKKVSGSADSALAEDEAYLTVTLAGGRVLERHVPHATGSPANPLTNAALEEKFRALASPALPAEQADQLLQAAWRLDQAPNLNEVTSLMVRPAAV